VVGLEHGDDLRERALGVRALGLHDGLFSVLGAQRDQHQGAAGVHARAFRAPDAHCGARGGHGLGDQRRRPRVQPDLGADARAPARHPCR
jgi:hypothetical protein